MTTPQLLRTPCLGLPSLRTIIQGPSTVMGANAVPFGAVSPAVAVLLPTPIRVVVAKRAWKQGLTSVIGDAMPGVLVRGRQGSQQDHPCTHNMYSSQCLVTIARYAGLGRPACGEIGKGLKRLVQELH